MKKILVAPLLLLSLSLMAAPTGEKRAREIAANFFASTATRGGSAPSLDLAWSGYDMEQNLGNGTTRTSQGASDDALLYIYNRSDAAGFVIVAGDDNAKVDIVGYSHDNSFDTANMADGAKALLQAWCREIADARTRNIATKRATRSTTSTRSGNLLYVTANWGQGTPFNNECPVFDGDRAVSGCVATAMAIICYHHKYPEKGVGETGAYSYTRNGSKKTIPNNVLGRTYDYDNMLSKYKGKTYTEEQGAAVAALMYDIGTATHISYGESTSGNITKMAQAMIDHFGYSKEMLYLRRVSYDDSEWFEMLRNNISTYGPTYYRGENSAGGGHAYVLDGYKENDYFHINYGWNGSSNGYYYLPNITYGYDQRCIFNMYPDKEGTTSYKCCLALQARETSSISYQGIHTDATKFEAGKPFNCYANVLNRGLSDFNGHYCIAHCDKDGNIKDVLASVDRTSTVLAYDKQTGIGRSVTITQSIEVGDCLRVFYKEAENGTWTQAKRINDTTIDNVVMCLSAEDVSKNVSFEYNKSSKTLTFGSQYATQCSVTDSSGKVIASGGALSGETATLNLSALTKGEYSCSFAVSGNPYSIKIINNSEDDDKVNLKDFGTVTDDFL